MRLAFKPAISPPRHLANIATSPPRHHRHLANLANLANRATSPLLSLSCIWTNILIFNKF
jgi:hypothetical protein